MAAANRGSRVRKISDLNYRELQQQVEKEIAPTSPLAYSTNGRTFGFSTSLDSPLSIGSIVLIETTAGSRYLGQVTSEEVLIRDGPEYGVEFTVNGANIVLAGEQSAQLRDRVKIRYLTGHGFILGKLQDDLFTAPVQADTFDGATIRQAPTEIFERYLSDPTPDSPKLSIGRSATHSDLRIELRASGFNRHTFLCGQSGSGKTFALGVLLEQLLLNTDLRIVVLDPNSDFVGLDTVNPINDIKTTPPLTSEQYADVVNRYNAVRSGILILRPSTPRHPYHSALKIRFSDFEREEQGRLLGMHPIDDREEFYAFVNLIRGMRKARYSLKDVVDHLALDFAAEPRRIGLRIQNLGIADWDIWAGPKDESLLEQVDKHRCTVVDIGALPSSAEKAAVAVGLLGYLWRRRAAKDRTLIVIDEAHNVAPETPTTDMEVRSSEYLVRIAGEGRKFGLFMLVASQRPAKLESNVVSQCDNLILMKMGSQTDLLQIARQFSGIPPSLVDLASTFEQGEALMFGKMTRSTVRAKFEGRLSPEGGRDIAVGWALNASNRPQS